MVWESGSDCMAECRTSSVLSHERSLLSLHLPELPGADGPLPLSARHTNHCHPPTPCKPLPRAFFPYQSLPPSHTNRCRPRGSSHTIFCLARRARAQVTNVGLLINGRSITEVFIRPKTNNPVPRSGKHLDIIGTHRRRLESFPTTSLW